jgi:Flp pilus assembly protein TadD
VNEANSRIPDDAAQLKQRAETVGAERDGKQEAVDLWRRYLQIAEASQTGEALLGLGRALVEARRSEEAVDVLSRCAEKMPDSFEVHELLGQVSRETGRLEAAVAAFGRAAELGPDEIQPRVALVVCLDVLGRSAEADEVIRTLGLRGSRDPAIRALLQELLQRRG